MPALETAAEVEARLNAEDEAYWEEVQMMQEVDDYMNSLLEEEEED